MRDINRWGLAAGLAAALAFYGNAQAQTTTSQGSSAGSSSTQSDQTRAPSSQHGMGMSDQSATPGSDQSSSAGTASAQGQTKLKKKLSDDLEKLHAANQAEIHMGEMAEQQASSSEVKEYGRKLVGDHKKLDEKLQSEASTVGVNLEGPAYQKAQKDAQKGMQKLQSKSGEAFDKEFMSMAEKDHKKDQKDVQKAAKEARNEKQEKIAALLDQADAGMQQHLDEAKRIKDVVSKEGKRQGRRAPETGTGTTGGSSQGGMSSQGTGSTGSSSQSQSGSSSDMGSKTGTTGKGSGSSATPHY